MNNKVIIGIVVVVIIVIGAVAFMPKNNSSSTQTSTPSQASQTQQPSQAAQTQTSSQSTAGKNAVTIQNFAYSPATITVKVGDKITWTNQDSIGHSATADNGSFDTGVLQQGQSGSITFSKAGTFTYHCSVHPNMKATVIVQ
jgi:plastocyanin